MTLAVGRLVFCRYGRTAEAFTGLQRANAKFCWRRWPQWTVW